MGGVNNFLKSTKLSSPTKYKLQMESSDVLSLHKFDIDDVKGETCE